jgi:hypothetical protein
MALVETGTVCKQTLDRPRRANRMRAIPETRPGCLAVAGAQPGKPDFNWSLKPNRAPESVSPALCAARDAFDMWSRNPATLQVGCQLVAE